MKKRRVAYSAKGLVAAGDALLVPRSLSLTTRAPPAILAMDAYPVP
jgi:hypothetical protein